MKRIYIAPQTDIETLHLKGSVLQDNTDPGYGRYSDTSDDVHANTVIFEESEMEPDIIASPNLWDE
jgi:hypothetical protein